VNAPKVFPDLVTVKVCDKQSQLPVCPLVVGLTIRVPRKNNYGIGPKITDELGVAFFTSEEIAREIELHKRVFLMDYSCDLSDAVGVEASVADGPQIQRMIEYSREWGGIVPEWRLSDETIEQLRNSVNNDFESCNVCVEIEALRRNPRIDIRVNRAGAGTTPAGM